MTQPNDECKGHQGRGYPESTSQQCSRRVRSTPAGWSKWCWAQTWEFFPSSASLLTMSYCSWLQSRCALCPFRIIFVIPHSRCISKGSPKIQHLCSKDALTFFFFKENIKISLFQYLWNVLKGRFNFQWKDSFSVFLLKPRFYPVC